MVLNWTLPESGVSDYDGIILDGSIRAGKTLPESLAYVEWAMRTYNGHNLGMAGKTLGALRRNVIGPLKQVLPGRGYKVRDVRSAEMPHLEISKGRRINQFHLFGGNNEKSQDPVQGFTGGGFLFDEVALMPQSFVNQAEGRCSDEDAKFWYNCNPEGPYNYINTEYLQKLDQKKLLHLHFLMDDNLSLSQKTRDRYERRWSKGSIFYRRYILGEWCLAEGLVYNMFDISKHVIHDLPTKWSNLVVGVDFGAASVTTYIMIGRAADGPHVGKWLAWKEYYHDATKMAAKTTFEFSKDMKTFLAREGGQWFPSSIEVDPSASPLKVQFRRDGLINMKDADNAVQAGIMDVASALSSGKLLIHESCKHLIGEIQTYSWDIKAAMVGEDKPIKKDDHVLDATRYAIRRIFRKAY